jgi:fluoride ion exporter CrcB/FEX
MPNISINFGRLLIFLGVAAYAYGYFFANPSVTALIPAIFGAILMVLGYVANAKESLRKHLMHGAVLIGLIGAIATVSSFLKIPSLINGTSDRPAAVIVQMIMFVVCLSFVILCVKSFINARKAA